MLVNSIIKANVIFTNNKENFAKFCNIKTKIFQSVPFDIVAKDSSMR